MYAKKSDKPRTQIIARCLGDSNFCLGNQIIECISWRFAASKKYENRWFLQDLFLSSTITRN